MPDRWMSRCFGGIITGQAALLAGKDPVFDDVAEARGAQRAAQAVV